MLGLIFSLQKIIFTVIMAGNLKELTPCWIEKLPQQAGNAVSSAVFGCPFRRIDVSTGLASCGSPATRSIFNFRPEAYCVPYDMDIVTRGLPSRLRLIEALRYEVAKIFTLTR